MKIGQKIFWGIIILLLITFNVINYNSKKENIDFIEIDTETNDTINVQDSILYYNNNLINYQNELDSIYNIQDTKDSLTIDELNYFDSLYTIYENDISNIVNRIDSLNKIQ